VGSREDAPPAHGGGFGNGFSREVVLRELDRILQSPSFRTSRQCQRFFRYVVEQTLDQNDDFLHERSIGREVFGRKADYDTSTDPIVRVRAGEIRKRLAQYYMESGTDCEVRFELPSGSYRAQLSGNEAAGATPKQPTVRPSRRIWPWLVGAVAVAVVASASLLLTGVYRESALDAFWRPVLSSNRPILICSGHPVVYFLSSRIHARYREQLSAKALPLQGPYVIPLRPDEMVEGRDIVPVTDQYIGAGDSVVATRLSALFGRHGKDWQLRFGNDVSFTDLRSAPAVLIGAFSNRWTLTMTEKLRFVFDFDGGVKRIIDHADARNEWALPDIAPDGRTTHDYAIVSRIFHSETGEMLISAAGITQYGTQATAEFLVNDDLIKQAVRDAPPDWKNRNMQVVLRTKVVGRTTGPPEILAVHFW
jgi:hypothetical protein